MKEVHVEKSVISYRWAFEIILPAMPLPTNPGFKVLCHKLKPFGISTSGIVAESPSSKLEDVVVKITLPDSGIQIQFCYDRFEIIFIDLLRKHYNLEILRSVVNISFEALQENKLVDITGKPSYLYQSHISLPSNNSKSFLAQYLPHKDNTTPDGFIYKLKWLDVENIKEARMSIQQSLFNLEGLYTEFFIDYDISTNPDESIIWFERDLKRAFSTFDLNIGSLLTRSS